MERTKKIQKPKTGQSKLNLDSSLVAKAFALVKQLHAKSNQNSNDLLTLNDNPFLYMTILVNELPTKMHIKPVSIPVTNSVYGPDFNTRCFFITTNQFKAENKEMLREFKGTWKFVSYEKFGKNYHEYKDRLALLKEYDLFFCDARIYSILKKHCGAHFYRKKKYPLPVDFSDVVEEKTEKIAEKSLALILESLLNKKTSFVQGNGPEYGVRVARLESFNDAQVLSNCKSALKGILQLLIERGLKLSSLRRVCLKGEQTESFPVFSHLTPSEKTALQSALKKMKKSK